MILNLSPFRAPEGVSGGGAAAPAATPAGGAPAAGGAGAGGAPSGPSGAGGTPPVAGSPAPTPQSRPQSFRNVAPANFFDPGVEPQLVGDDKGVLTADAYAKYQRDVKAYQANVAFRQSLAEVFDQPQDFGDGLNFAFADEGEAKAFHEQYNAIATGKRPITGRDILAITHLPRLLAMAREQGAKAYEAKLKGPQRPTDPTRPSTVVDVEGQNRSVTRPGKVPSVRAELEATPDGQAFLRDQMNYRK